MKIVLQMAPKSNFMMFFFKNLTQHKNWYIQFYLDTIINYARAV